MVKKKIIGLTILPILLLSSCGQQRPLRSDIAEFIASFSLEESTKEYVEAGYTSLEESFIDGVNYKIIENLDFNVRDDTSISYEYTYKEYEEETITENKYIEIKTVDNEYYYVDESTTEKSITKAEIMKLVLAFFYKVDDYDFHNYGCYYGDIVRENAGVYQDYTTIDKENELYILDYEILDERVNATIKQHLTVNPLGMLVDNSVLVSTNNNYSRKVISVYKK